MGTKICIIKFILVWITNWIYWKGREIPKRYGIANLQKCIYFLFTKTHLLEDLTFIQKQNEDLTCEISRLKKENVSFD